MVRNRVIRNGDEKVMNTETTVNTGEVVKVETTDEHGVKAVTNMQSEECGDDPMDELKESEMIYFD